MKKLTLLLIAMLGLAGCPDSKSSNRQNGYGGVVGSCVNCGFTPATFSQAVSSQIPQAGLTLIIEGDLNQMNMWGQQGQNPLFSYQGPVAVGGNLNVVSPLILGMCQLPAGQYTVRTLQAGIYNLGTFQVPVVELVGPTRMVVTLTQGTILTDGNGSIASFGALIVGQQGPVMSGWGYQVGGCMDQIGVRF